MIVLSQYVTNAVSCIELPSTLLSVSPLLCFCCPGTTYHHPGTKPTLPKLLRFTCADKREVNIAEEIALKFVLFGTFLLDDRTGLKVEMLAHKHHSDAVRINTAILQEWLNGRGMQPVTWATLVEVLHCAKLSALASEIEAVKCSAGESISVIDLYWLCIIELSIHVTSFPGNSEKSVFSTTVR